MLRWPLGATAGAVIPQFPASFRFGVATADHQCEAHIPGQDDIRDRWEAVRGLTARGKATDFWNRYSEDIETARQLGCRAFRLSLSWATLEPAAGQWDSQAFAHYRQVLQRIRDADMVAVVTLHHNTWPIHVQASGAGAGLLDAGFPELFAAYARQVAEQLGDLIDYYVTINEPNQLVYGFIKGWGMRAYPMPPGLEPFATSAEQMDAVLRLIPNLFRAHSRARTAIRGVHPTARVGANPLILGLPRCLQALVDRRATRVRNPADVRKQSRTLSQREFLESGAVDLSIAQITLTQNRMDQVLFSEPYFIAHLCALHPATLSLPADLATWPGRIGVTRNTAPAYQAPTFFPAASIISFQKTADTMAGLSRGEIDLVFDDDVVLRQYVSDGLVLVNVAGSDQPFAAAMALGSRTLLNAVDIALREFKLRDASGLSRWDQAMEAAFPGLAHDSPPNVDNRKTVANIGKAAAQPVCSSSRIEVPDLDKSLQAIRNRGLLRVGVHPGVVGLCMQDASGSYSGLEIDLANYVAQRILGPGKDRVLFVSLSGQARLNATRSWLRFLDPLRRTISMLTTIVATNWWNLGMAGKLPEFLCPAECIGQLDYVGLDYYWGVRTLWPSRLQHLASAAESRYANAPVWPEVLYDLLREQQQQFPGKPIIVVENGCVPSADGVSRSQYLERHIYQVQRAVADGVPVEAYLCWSITSNREWGLTFDENSDFGIYRIDLDHDPNLERVATPSAKRYAEIIAKRSAIG